ncbi:hypothetical protein GCM10020256_66710 [Streptomyces thermocoprophilus]
MTTAADRSRRPRRPAWAGRNYSLLTAAAFLTNGGSQAALIASAFAVLEAGGDSGDVGLVAAARTLPLVLFLLIGGAVADRLPRHRVMVAANALNCVSQGVFAVLVLAGEPRLWQMMLLTALGGTAQAFFAPASEGMLLSSVHGEQAGRAFAVFRMAMQGAALGGAAVGGALVAVVGPGWVLAADAAAFAVAGALRALLDVRHIPPRAAGGGMLADLKEGWREFTGRPWLWGIVAQFAVANAVIGAADAVYGPLVARDRLGGAGPWGAGAGVLRRGHRRRCPADDAVEAAPTAARGHAVRVPDGAAVGRARGARPGERAVRGDVPRGRDGGGVRRLLDDRPASGDPRGETVPGLRVRLVRLGRADAGGDRAGGPAESAVGRTNALWGCAALVVAVTALVLCVPDVRRLRRRTTTVAKGAVESADAESAVGGLG